MSAKYAELFSKAVAAGYAAGNGAEPVPMIVGSAKSLFGSEMDLSKPRYFVADGACGFAWVKVRPGNSRFAKWLVKEGHAHKAYSGGVDIWISAHNQSVARKEAHAGAMADVLREGLSGENVSVYADSRLD